MILEKPTERLELLTLTAKFGNADTDDDSGTSAHTDCLYATTIAALRRSTNLEALLRYVRTDLCVLLEPCEKQLVSN
jgi:hypothetical protein